ncbi:MAG: hypothetical protein F6K18_14370 [Okeania sp. SIO2C2]|uniref:hypothetical protein n=1 Tax=Okeania sp. SIO2C2 TaxID=2607787 RepID=UPI0013B8E535|nr:hypothetical protein [Okeania sp. SIO2C2]NEP87906.1 hypothetical protein [Okeania sp. SIO2C2]
MSGTKWSITHHFSEEGDRSQETGDKSSRVCERNEVEYHAPFFPIGVGVRYAVANGTLLTEEAVRRQETGVSR